MTEEEWLKCEVPEGLIEQLTGKASERKLRLFCVACCRSVWPLLSEPETKRAIELSETFADNPAVGVELTDAANVVNEMTNEDWLNGFCGFPTKWDYDDFFLRTAATWEAAKTPVRPEGVSAKIVLLRWEIDKSGSTATQNALLLRDIFGNPFRPVTLDPKCLTPTVQSLAHAIYNDRDFDRLPILADALEEAGCDTQDVLHHLRSGDEHVRGCWALDIVLGKS